MAGWFFRKKREVKNEKMRDFALQSIKMQERTQFAPATLPFILRMAKIKIKTSCALSLRDRGS